MKFKLIFTCDECNEKMEFEIFDIYTNAGWITCKKCKNKVLIEWEAWEK